MSSVSKEHHSSLSPPLQGSKIVRTVLKNGASISPGNQTFDGLVPSFEHSQKLAPTVFVRVYMIRIGIRRRIPSEPIIARSENAKTLSSSPGFAVGPFLSRALKFPQVPSNPVSREKLASEFQ